MDPYRAQYLVPYGDAMRNAADWAALYDAVKAFDEADPQQRDALNATAQAGIRRVLQEGRNPVNPASSRTLARARIFTTGNFPYTNRPPPRPANELNPNNPGAHPNNPPANELAPNRPEAPGPRRLPGGRRTGNRRQTRRGKDRRGRKIRKTNRSKSVY